MYYVHIHCHTAQGISPWGKKLTKVMPAMFHLLPLKLIHPISFWPLFSI